MGMMGRAAMTRGMDKNDGRTAVISDLSRLMIGRADIKVPCVLYFVDDIQTTTTYVGHLNTIPSAAVY